ncbi:MAG: hypothetical protein WCO65_01715 [bacterium]
MKISERGFADYATIIIGLIFGGLIIGFFLSSGGLMNKVNLKSAMRLPCGLTYSGVADNQKIVFPFEVTGYINGCGWQANKGSAGTVQIFDGKGLPITSAQNIPITDTGTDLPLAFTAIVRPTAAPQTDTGQLVIRSTTGLLKIIPVTF